MEKSKFNDDIKKMAEEDPLRTLTLFLKYKFPIRKEEFNYLMKNAEAFDYFKTHKILIEYEKEKLDSKLFDKLLTMAEANYDGSYTQMLVLFEIGKQYIEQNPEKDYSNNDLIRRLIKLSPISLNFLDLKPEMEYAICNSFRNSKDIELVASILKSGCLDKEGFGQIKKDLEATIKDSEVKDNNILSGLDIIEPVGTMFTGIIPEIDER